MYMSKTWCPDCKREVLNVVGFIADGWEFTCGKCNQRFVVRIERVLTKRALDGAYCSCQNPDVYINRICQLCGLPHAPRQ
jgi:transposase-like protein